MPTHGACGQSWNGTRPAHCSGCCQTFSGVALFDRHRNLYGEHGTCVDPATMPNVELRDGVWSNPQMTELGKREAFGRR